MRRCAARRSTIRRAAPELRTKILVDTNILLRLADPASAQHQLAGDAVERLIRRGDELCLVPQVVAEFWYAATQPVARNGLGFPFETVAAEHSRFLRIFRLLRDEPAIYDVWERFVLEHQVTRGRLYDARLVAALEVHGFDRLLTFDTRDFARWSVSLLEPGTVMSGDD